MGGLEGVRAGQAVPANARDRDNAPLAHHDEAYLEERPFVMMRQQRIVYTLGLCRGCQPDRGCQKGLPSRSVSSNMILEEINYNRH